MKRYKEKSKKNGQVSGLIRARKHKAHVGQVNRRRVILRDNMTCYMCSRKLGYREIILDHVIPLSRQGPHTEENLKVACPSCNSRKGDKLPEECEWLKQSTGELIINKH